VLIAPPGAAPQGAALPAHATVSVNAIGPLDLLEVAVSGLRPGRSYTLWLGASRTAPFGQREPLVTFKTNVAGAQVAQAIGPLRQVLGEDRRDRSEQESERFLVVTDAQTDALELIEGNSVR
jgi:hypothetical protein